MPPFNSPRPFLAVAGFIVCLLVGGVILLGVAATIPAWLIWIVVAIAFACMIF